MNEKMPNCPVCDGERTVVFNSRILHKYDVDYWLCGACGFLQTEKPYWLDEAYAEAVVAADTGLVKRNIRFSEQLIPLLTFLDGGDGDYLDAAGGYGMMTRLMRDAGFNFFWQDLYCQNLLAIGFEGGKERYAAVTAFEVLEHVHDPVEFLSDLRSSTGCSSLILSTELYKQNAVPPSDWWYYSQETGQHISFHTRESMEALGDKLGLNYFSLGSFHIFSSLNAKKKLALLKNRYVSKIACKLLQRYGKQSLTNSDRELLLNEGSH